MKGKYEHKYTPRFNKLLKKLYPSLKSEAVKAINDFKDETNHQSLKLHKLTGALDGHYSFSINYKYRIIIKFVATDVVFLDIGDHDIYK